MSPLTRRRFLTLAARCAAVAPVRSFAASAETLPEVPIQFMPREGTFWDHWLFRAPDKRYHLFYLYEPPGVAEALRRKSWCVGHAVSTDLSMWDERPVALRPGKDTWVDRGYATGSTIDFGGRYAMLVTGYTLAKGQGMALAWSEDLDRWTVHGDRPLLPPPDSGQWYETPGQMAANPPECAGWCDPFLVRKPGDDAVYAVINGRVREGDMYARGSFALARTTDMLHWEMQPPLFVPGFCTRCETAQLFTRGGRWYLLASMWPKLLTTEFKAQYPDERYAAAALCWTAERFEGPYRLAGDWALFPKRSCYICKVIEAPDHGDAILTIRMGRIDGKPAAGLSPAYRVSYPPEGGIRIHYEQALA